MDRIVIHGGVPLHGTISISGAKNAVLPLMAASILTKDTVTIVNIPQLADVVTMSRLLINHGVNILICGHNLGDCSNSSVMKLNAEKINNYEAPYEIVRKMRASVLVLGPLLAKFGTARVSLPGGCAIGTRPLDLHIKALEAMGAKIILNKGYIEATTKDGLKGTEINFESVSVGATENILMAATLAEGVTVIRNAAKEPEVCDLVKLLNKMGANISGEGTSTITIKGVAKLKGAHHQVIPDRIEAATYATAAIITGGEVILENMNYDIFSNIAEKLKLVGAKIKGDGNKVIVKTTQHREPIDITTGAYPGFPTDMQAQLMSLLSLSSGTSTIKENIFENRYMHVSELNRMGADISVHDRVAKVRGVKSFYGAEVMATDLRASVSLVIAGLAAKGKTIINRVYHIDRGYGNIEYKLNKCGAKIARVV
jgi:UDP-N-acetylglucosamine 1-carboxyvinyltransferase